MVEAPQIGREYWIIIDFWEQEAAVPVTLISEADGWYTGRWHISDDFTEDYNILEPRDLFHTQKETWEAINEGKRQCDERSGNDD